ncbi:MAG: phycobiliprotein lyase [Pseudanabaenaceae cyanobacterium SKYGB_i_bin29]|nr:phycobiliprotein lyase [Pseudanabaenaceae cyanobacterium SKYG29]MDW8422270.1 phycobiliprotein lyase [Pseudanabaenaceae cyanobacterium SKYGB_i_bin29]
MDVMEFFQRSSGRWLSRRTTHHLAFQRSETGESYIEITALAADHPQIISTCELHEVDPQLAIGGAYVTWNGSMAWDKEGEKHEGSTLFALIPDPAAPQRGKLLRDRGYAETVPVAGSYHMDNDCELVLITEYPSMHTIERFWFTEPNVRLRTSTVQWLGGITTATFCTETRLDTTVPTTSYVKLPAFFG